MAATYEIDHLFICVNAPGKEAERLSALGLTEGTPNVHDGQGTENRRFFFTNFYLELLWVANPQEAKSDLVRPMGLWERWEGRRSGACPFGFGIRPTQQATLPPFPTWDYSPPYLPDGMALPVATNSSNPKEPVLFFLPWAVPPSLWQGDRRQPMLHPAGVREVTKVRLYTPYLGGGSTILGDLGKLGLIEVLPGPQFLVELFFDGNGHGTGVDLRPDLPAVFSFPGHSKIWCGSQPQI